MRETANTETEAAKTAYIRNRLFEALGKEEVWKQLRNLGLLPKQCADLGGFTPEEINEHFAGVSHSPSADSGVLQDIVESASDCGFRFHSITLSDIVLAIRHFSSQAVGEDGIPQSVVIKALPTIGCLLVKLFNSSLQCGVFPALWRKARVTPIKKTTTPSSTADFRPIAILCFLSKVLEKIAHTQLIEHLEGGRLLDPLQTGFRSMHSTQTALLKITDDIRTGIDNRQLTLLLLFDFSKAFDTVPHSILLSKLRSLGFSRTVLAWFCSYLTGREQKTTARGFEDSSWLCTNLGVPQGSVLGPLLFALYINDISEIFDSRRIKHVLYADDLQLYLHIPRDALADGIRVLEGAADAVAEWAERSALSLNAGKTKATVLGSRKFISDINANQCQHLRLRGGITVPFSDTVVSLGVVLDSTLSWRPHIDAVAKKFNRVLYSLRFFRKYTSEVLRKQLAMALLFPHLDYCSVVYLDASQEQKRRIQRLQNSCVRYIYGVRADEHITPYRVQLGWMRADTRRHYFLGVQLYKVIRMRAPSYLSEMFKKFTARGLSRGEVRELAVPMMRTECGKLSFQAFGANYWNTLPSQIRNLPSLNSFKMALRRHLLELD